MSLPAADLPAPIAVLVLAWDEATPAVRALVEATQAPTLPVDSILVMVPQADAPDHLSAEEYLPLPAATQADSEPLATEETPQDIVEAVEPTATSLAATEPEEANTTSSQLAPSAAPNADLVPETPPRVVAAPLWAAVRVLRLASHSLPQLARRAGQLLPAPLWLGSAQWPAAPYLGATLPSTPPAASPVSDEAFDSTLLASEEQSAYISTADSVPTPPVLPLTQVAAATPAAPEGASAADASVAPLYEPAEATPQGILETDLPLAQSEANALEEAPSRDLFQEVDFSPSPAQADWPAALAALRQPAPLAPPAAAEPLADLALASAEPAPGLAAEAPGQPAAALRPTAAHYPAPNLNFQIIQYARFAVPVALTETDFATIYAPAWPTWLAAQELRQRTGRPLVLHVTTLAAGAEPLGTATGWMAELQRQALLRADLVLAETPALAERLRHELGLPFGAVLAVAAADAAGIAQALHAARPRPVAG